jgi:hypothetical protein
VIKIESLNYIIKNNKYNTCICVECKTQEEINNLLKRLNLDVEIKAKAPLHLSIILKKDGKFQIIY